MRSAWKRHLAEERGDRVVLGLEPGAVVWLQHRLDAPIMQPHRQL